MQFTPIKMLNPFMIDWCIKARVVNRTQVRTYYNNRHQGRLFNAELMDDMSTRIHVTFFNDSCDKFCDYVKQGKVYTFSGGLVKISNKKWTSISNDYCLVFDHDSVI